MLASPREGAKKTDLKDILCYVELIIQICLYTMYILTADDCYKVPPLRNSYVLKDWVLKWMLRNILVREENEGKTTTKKQEQLHPIIRDLQALLPSLCNKVRPWLTNIRTDGSLVVSTISIEIIQKKRNISFAKWYFYLLQRNIHATLTLLYTSASRYVPYLVFWTMPMVMCQSGISI